LRHRNRRIRLEKLEQREAPKDRFQFVCGSPLKARGDKPSPGAFTFQLDYNDPDPVEASAQP
jgi:hypothetical protein